MYGRHILHVIRVEVGICGFVTAAFFGEIRCAGNTGEVYRGLGNGVVCGLEMQRSKVL